MDATLDINPNSVAFSGYTNSRVLQINLDHDNIQSFTIAATTISGSPIIAIKVDEDTYPITTEAQTYDNFNTVSLLYIGSAVDKVSVQFTNVTTK